MPDAEVLKRADRQGTEMQGHVFAPFLEDESIATDASEFRALLKTALQALFDSLVENPRIIRILNWEQAEGWHTWTKIASSPETLARVQEIIVEFIVHGMIIDPRLAT